jgi:2-polyprenyl-3-methyl-5-hydroxy-6-metoxy-1,4-benzoquinol methylase/glycosyltransferase involved in cell wall biosynthesis
MHAMNSATGAAIRIGNFRTFPISRELNGQTSSTDANILRLVGRNKRVLELGCGFGHMSRGLREQGCTVVAIEIHPEAAQSAAQVCERVIIGDLDYLNFERELSTDRFDVVVAADVLEHLKDPLSVLQAIRQFLLPQGHVVVSIPNVAHISVRLALLAGKFPYSQTGLLDQTHLRFITRESLEKLMEDADLAIGHFVRITKLPDDPMHFEVPYDPTLIPAALLEELSRDPEAQTYQFVLSGYPLPQSGLTFIQGRIKHLAHEADRARTEAAHLRLQLERAEECSAALAAEKLTADDRVATLTQRTESLQSEISLLQDLCEESERAAGHLRLQLTQAEERSAALAAEKTTNDDRIAILTQRTESLQSEILRLKDVNDESESALELIQEEVQAQSNRSSLLASERAATEERLVGLAEERDCLQEEIATLRHISHKSQSKFESLEEDIRERDSLINNHMRKIAGLNTQVETLLTREKDLRDMLLEAHDQLLKRDEEIALTLASALPPVPAAPPTSVPPPPQPAPGAGGKYLQYQQLIQKIRELVRGRVAEGGSVLVVSKGDDDLLQLDPCRGSHFPQREDGRYAGYYPSDGEAAVDHLRELKKQGSQYFMIPQTALWWLDHYRELADYLDRHCARIIDEPTVCVMFDMVNAKKNPAATESHVSIRSSPRIMPFGVNIAGNITSEKGVGEAVRAQARSFLAAGVPFVLNNVVEDTAVNLVDEFCDFSDDNPYAVNLIHLNADALPDFVDCHETDYFRDRYNIGFWAWETSKFPNEWWDRFQYLDEIWVGSDFVLDAISRVSPIPVVKAPLAVPNRSSLCPYSRSHFGLNSKTFVFLFVFDYMSIAQRKNPIGLVEAFRKAFSTRDDVTLLLKCGHSEAHPLEATMLKKACKGANITIVDTVFSREEMNSLMSAADCYVSLHRSEGFGLTMAEAMSLGKPVIATAFSGNMEYMTPANSYLVRYKLVEIDKPCGPYREGTWAEPDLEHAAELMRFVVKNRSAAKEVSRHARADILSRLSPRATGTVMCNRLLRIAGLGRISAPEMNTGEDQPTNGKSDGFYRPLVDRIRQVVETNLPTDARVVVASRGDDDLLIYSGRDGWHFPQDSQGRYAGYYPGTGSEAIGYLEALRHKGGEYFLLPQTGFWWLDYYAELRSHLDRRYRKVWSNADCIIYGLAEKSNGVVSRFREKLAMRAHR